MFLSINRFNYVDFHEAVKVTVSKVFSIDKHINYTLDTLPEINYDIVRQMEISEKTDYEKVLRPKKEKMKKRKEIVLSLA